MEKGRVYSYLRFSDPRQAAGSSVDRQMAYAQRWADEHGMVLDAELSMRDEGLSAYHQQHIKSGALGAFLAAVAAGSVPVGSVLIVEGLDRLSRAEPILAQAQLAQIVNAGITLVTASDGKAYNRERLRAQPMDLVYSLLVMIRAHEESDTKSRRVKAAIRRQCEAWIAGTFRGKIRSGRDPAWIVETSDGWAIDEARAAAARVAIDAYLEGYGNTRISDMLIERGLKLSPEGLYTHQVYRLVRQRALIGEKTVTVDGQEYVLAGYYPPLVTPEVFARLEAANSGRSYRATKGEVPSILTGIGVAVCGHCGAAISAATMRTKGTRRDGSPYQLKRRFLCNKADNRSCRAGSAAAGVIEAAIIRWCSDQINLSSLVAGSTVEAGLRAELVASRADLAKAAGDLERVAEALLADDGGAVPMVFVRKARALETDIERLQERVLRSEQALAAAARRDTGGSAAWQALAQAVLANDYDARIKMRRLVADTFRKIAITVPVAQIPRVREIDVLLIARSGASRRLLIDRTSGEMLAVDDAATGEVFFGVDE